MKEKMNTGTNSNVIKSEPFTIEDLKKIALGTIKMPSISDIPTKKIGIFEKIMNKLGWYRQYEAIILDTRSLYNFPMRSPYDKNN